MATGKDFPMSAFEQAIASDPDILGAFYSGSQGRGTMDRYSDLDLMVWVTKEAYTEGRAKIEALLSTLGQVQSHYPLHPTSSTTALVGPDWQRVDLELLREEDLKPWPGWAGARILKDANATLSRVLAQAPARPEPPTIEEAADLILDLIDSQIFIALQTARGGVWSGMGEVGAQAMALYTFLARLRGVNSYGPRYIEQLLFPHERELLEATVVARAAREEVRRAARGLWAWTRYVWRETEQVLGGALPISLDEDGLLSAVEQIYAWR
jgi:hypothetical protein